MRPERETHLRFQLPLRERCVESFIQLLRPSVVFGEESLHCIEGGGLGRVVDDDGGSQNKVGTVRRGVGVRDRDPWKVERLEVCSTDARLFPKRLLQRL